MNAFGSENTAKRASEASTRTTDRSFLSGHSQPEGQRDDNPGQLATYRLSELRPHTSYARLRLTVPASSLTPLAEQGDLAFREPLVITRQRIVIDGYARLELARLQGRLTLPCIEYELSEEEALRWLLQKHRRSNGMNDFFRILLALELEPSLKDKAVSNQRLGGRMKGSSNLTEDATVDVRKEIAAAAGVAVGNVTKVKQLVGTGHSELLEALRGGEVSIHRAWKWSMESHDRQTKALRTYRNKQGVNKAIRDLISRHEPRNLPTAPDLASMVRRLSELSSGECSSVSVSVIRGRGKMVFVTEELMQSLPQYQESIPTCTADSR
jgi:hypothetical protein